MSEVIHSHDQEALSCTHVVEEGKPVLFVSHDEDGSWQYLCGGQHEDDPESCLIVCNGCLGKKDASLKGIETLPVGHCAERVSEDEKSWEVYELE